MCGIITHSPNSQGKKYLGKYGSESWSKAKKTIFSQACLEFFWECLARVGILLLPAFVPLSKFISSQAIRIRISRVSVLNTFLCLSFWSWWSWVPEWWRRKGKLCTNQKCGYWSNEDLLFHTLHRIPECLGRQCSTRYIWLLINSAKLIPSCPPTCFQTVASHMFQCACFLFLHEGGMDYSFITFFGNLRKNLSCQISTS